MSVRRIEVRLTGLEDRILDKLGYREYEVTVLTQPPTVLEPIPSVKPTNLSQLGPDQLEAFNQVGGYGNVASLFTCEVSRLIPEQVVRSQAYWLLTRDTYEARCLVVSVTTLDSRYQVILGVLKDA